MLYSIPFLIVVYILTYLGYFLKKISKEEIEELKNKIYYSSLIINLIYVILLIVFASNIFYLVITLIILYSLSIRTKNIKVANYTNLFLSFVILVIYSFEQVYLIVLPLIATIIHNSITQINKREEITNIALFVISIITLILIQNI